ncbi:MAG: hypothetical protein V1672_03525 [Candidatus Diapherotrites archaeon]
MVPGLNPFEFFRRVKNARREKLEKQGIRPKPSKKEILEQHIERQPEVIKELSKRDETLKSRHKQINDSMIGMPVVALDEFKTHFAKYNDAYSDFLAATKKNHVGLTELEALELFLANAKKVRNLKKKESLIRHYEERRLWLDSKLTTLENAEEELIKVLMKKGILQKDFR